MVIIIPEIEGGKKEDMHESMQTIEYQESRESTVNGSGPGRAK